MNKFLKKSCVAMFATVLSFAAAAPLFAQNLKIRVGATVSVDGATSAFLWAVDNGSFAKAGLDVDVKSFVQANQKYDTIKAGGLDVDMNMGVVNAAQLYSSGMPIQVLRANTLSYTWAVVALPNSKLTKPQDFKGKKFGVMSLSGTNYGITYQAFKIEGVDFQKDVRVSTLPSATLFTALENGDIEGATTFEPFLSQGLKAGRIKILFRPGDIYQKKYNQPYLALAVGARKEFVQKNRAAMVKFMAVLEEAIATAPQHSEEVAKATIKYMPEMKISVADAKELLDSHADNVIKTQNTPAMIKAAQDMYNRLYESKQLQESVKASDFWIKL
jgi:ABC-type nitrate/sulfonate/bicarbonate transport system substrate-binding protein